jgi:RNA-binding protein
MITPKMKRRIKNELSTEKPTIWIGKEGTSPQILNEISRQLEKREMIKVKVLRSALKEEETKKIASKITQQTESTLIDVRGHTVILYKPRKRKK